MTGVLSVVVFFGVLPQGAMFVIDSDREVYDRIIRSGGGPEEREDFVLLGIDEASLSLSNLSPEEIEGNETLGMMKDRFPWDRRVWAEAIERLIGAGAKLVVLDLVFAEPGSPEEDAALAAVIAAHPRKVVLASVFSPLGQQEDGHEVFTLVEPYVEFLESDPEPRIGFANFRPNQRDGTCRVARYRSTLGRENMNELTGELEFLSLAAQIMHAHGADIPEEDKEIRFTSDPGTWGTEVYAPRSLYEIFSERYWQRNYDSGAFFKDKTVMIGPVAARFQDIHETPVGTITGPQLHMQAAACGLAQAYVHHVGHPLWVMSLLGLLAALIAGWLDKTRNSAIAIVLLLAAFVLGVWWFGKFHSVMIPLTGGLIAAVVGWMSAQVHQLIRERMEKDRLRGVFRRFVSRDVADRLVDQPEEWEAIAAGRKRQVVVLFSDVRGFTSRSESAEPAELVQQLNEYLSAMVEVVFRHGGTLDKFIGDAVMAHWGSIDGDQDDQQYAEHSRAALAAARDMQLELESLNRRWEQQGRKPFEMGVGIHLGEVVAGELGSPERIEFGVIGDAVNLASRIEGLTKSFGCGIIFSERVKEAANAEDAHSLGKVRVKGRSAPVELHAYGDKPSIEKALAQLHRDPEGVIVMDSK
ncbi:MAG: adenylate/guanylate cyclase domain-containing protein [Akkermansiaceae bacterium]|nr:adenylate/guanylate cyclase domain-containing protein [Akkermansiaceae bacterium]